MLLTVFAAVACVWTASIIAVKVDPTLGTCEKSGTRCKFSPAASSISYCWSAPVWDKTLANTFHIGFSSKHTKPADQKKSAVCFCPTENNKQATILDAMDEKDVPRLKQKGLEIDAGNVDDECRTWDAECILDEKNQQCRLSVFYDPKTYCLPVPAAAGIINYLYVDVPATYHGERSVSYDNRIGCYCQNWKKAGGYFFHPANGITVSQRKQAVENKFTDSHKPDHVAKFNDYSSVSGGPGVQCAN